MNETKFIILNRIFSCIIALSFIVYLIFANTLPFGISSYYISKDQSISPLSPASRVETQNIDGAQVTKQKDDLIYFTTKFPFKFDTAKIKVSFQNPNPEQQIELGYKDRAEWHYDYQILDSSIFKLLEWNTVGNNPVLYQKNNQYNSAEEFLKNLPPQAIIGTLNYSIPVGLQTMLPDYKPSANNSIIDVPLRGNHIMYAYLENEPFELTIKKQDLNWYEDPDVMEVKIYKDDALVLTTVIDDDGIADNSRQAGPEIEAVIKNPGPELPESGVYKIVFDGSADTIIKSIKTNLHKLVFEGPIYPISNAEVYPGTIQNSFPTTIYTNSRTMTAVVHHNAALQDINVNNTSVSLSTTSFLPKVITTTATSSKIVIPKSDTIISGIGYYAFSEDQFFLPSQYTVLPITSSTDINLVDYIITPYSKPIVQADGYSVVEREFDVTSAVPDKGRLSWIIRAPGLKENNREVIIKDIEVTYTKKGWWKNDE